MISMLIGVFLFLLFLVAIILSAKTWRGWQIAAMSVAFLGALGLVLIVAMSAKTHTTWQKRLSQYKKQLQDAQAEGQRLAYGDPDTVKPTEPSLHDIQQTLKRLLLDRGRVWRQCTPGAPAGNSVVVSTVAPDVPEDQIQPNGISQDMVVYVFREAALKDGLKVPAAYLGEYRVTKADARNVTLQPTLPLDKLQQKLVADRSATWSLYEMMPIDSHQIFASEDTIGKMLNDTDEPLFGPIDEKTMREVFSVVMNLPPDNPKVAQFVSSYVQDGRPATAQEISAQPEQIWMKLEFEKEYKERVDSNNLVQGLSGGFFDPEGYADVPQLLRGEDAVIRVKDIGVFPYGQDEDKKFVDSLIASGVCRSLGPYYVRPLRDYEEAFHQTQENLVACYASMQRARRDIKALNDTIRGTQQQTAYRQEELSKLQSDRDKTNMVRAQVTKLAAGMHSLNKALQETLSDLFGTNLALSQQLTQLDQRLTEEINRRTAEVTAQVN